MTSAGDDTRLLTYAELGRARGISAASAKRLALRQKWAKVPGNDGLARVHVPVMALEAPSVVSLRHIAGGTSPETVSVTALARVQRDAEAAIQAAEARAEVAAQEMATLRMQLAQRTGEVDGLREGMQQALGRAERAEREVREVTGELAKQRERAGRAEGEALALRDAVERERELARAAEAAGGPLARAWRALLNLRR